MGSLIAGAIILVVFAVAIAWCFDGDPWACGFSAFIGLVIFAFYFIAGDVIRHFIGTLVKL